MTGRNQLKQAFLVDAGWQDSQIKPLAGDASFRRYDRLSHNEHGPAVLMDAPPQMGEDCRPFVAINQWLEDHGFRAAHIFAHDVEHGFVLLEDLGDNLFARHLGATPLDERALYEAAIDTLVALHQIKPPQTMALDYHLPDYDHAELLREVMLVPDWYWPATKGADCPEAVKADYQALWQDALQPLWPPQQPVLVLRDYHAENLFWLPDGDQPQDRVGIIDHQDALTGHPVYDLVSLLEDARRLITPDLRMQMINRYADAVGADRDTLNNNFALMAAQRNAKIVGIFARLENRDGKQGYLAKTPLVWSYLRQDLTHPALTAIKHWFNTHFPNEMGALS